MKKKFNLEIGWSDHTVNPLLIYKLYKEYNLKLFELHFDLDGKGWEFKDSKHCWLPFQIKELVNFINNVKCMFVCRMTLILHTHMLRMELLLIKICFVPLCSILQ